MLHFFYLVYEVGELKFKTLLIAVLIFGPAAREIPLL